MSSYIPDTGHEYAAAQIRYGKPVLAVLVALLMTFAAVTPGNAAQSIFDACYDSLAKYCSDVTPGDGRLVSCLYSHEDKVSDACDIAFAETGDIIDMLFETLRSAKHHCQGDISQWCADAVVGSGEVLHCLVENRSSLSDGCGGVVDRLVLPTD